MARSDLESTSSWALSDARKFPPFFPEHACVTMDGDFDNRNLMLILFRTLTTLKRGVLSWPCVITLLSLAVVLILPLVTYILSLLSLRTTRQLRSSPRLPPIVPYSLPFFCNALDLARNPAHFIKESVSKYGIDGPLRVKAGTFEYCLITDSVDIRRILKSSKWLTSKPVALFAMKHILAMPKEALSLYGQDDSGMGTMPRPESTVSQDNRIHYLQIRLSQKYLSGKSVINMAERYMEVLKRRLCELNRGRGWFEIHDLYSFLQVHVTEAAIEAVMGSSILEQYPGLISDYWTFDRNLKTYSCGVPRLLALSAFRTRDRLLGNLKSYLRYAHKHSDCSNIAPADPDWDEHFGTKFIKARESGFRKLAAFNEDARASETLGFLLAMNGSTVPSVFWYVFEALRSTSLRDQLLAEVAECTDENGALNLVQLSKMPLSQSAYAETLRLRVAIPPARASEFGDFSLSNGYVVPKNIPMVMFNHVSALNYDAWARARPQAVKESLENFWAQRFLIEHQESDEEESSVAANVGMAETKSEPTTNVKTSKKLKFSLDGLAGLWIPFGGGIHMCPGRHFAQFEIIGTLAVLTELFDFEFTQERTVVDDIRPDLRRVPYGGLPPLGQVSMKLRRRMP